MLSLKDQFHSPTAKPNQAFNLGCSTRTAAPFRVVWMIWLVALGVAFSNFKAIAYTATDAQTMVTSFNNAFYFTTNGNLGYFRNTTDGGTTWFWGRANQMEMLIDLYEQSSNTVYLTQFQQLYNGFVSDYGTDWIWNEFNDDIMWMVIACSRAYQYTANTTYRDVARSNFDSCYARAWSSDLGGGLWWKSPLNTSKNACVNGPAAIASYLIYQNYGDTNYLAKSETIYQWERATLVDTNTGRVYDSINISGTKDMTPITYNEGTFIGAANFLGYTNDAILAANYTKNSMGTGGQLPNYEEDSDLGGFNGIFIRWMVKFMNQRGLQSSYQLWLQQNANAAWNVRRSSDNLSWSKWWDQTPDDARFSFGCWGSVLIVNLVPPTQNPGGSVVFLNASDAANTSSFESGLNWAGGAAPLWTTHYVVAGSHTLRTPQDPAHHTFAGSSLTLSNGGVLAFKNTSGSRYVSIGTDLFLDGGEVANWAGNSALLGGKVTLQSGGGKIDPQGNSFSFPALISGLGALRIGAGASSPLNGTVTLSGVNSYTGGTVIEAPHTLQISAAGTLGSSDGALTFTNAGRGFGTLNLNGSDLAVGNLSGGGGTIWNNMSGTNNVLTIGSGNASGGVFQGLILAGAGGLSLRKAGNGTNALTAMNTFVGNTTISGGALQLGDGISRNGGVTGEITNNATVIFANPSTQIFNGTVRGSGALVKTGAGQLTLTGAQAYTGNTAVNAGVFALSGIGSITNSAEISIASGASFDVLSRADQTLTLNGGQLLRGSGTIIGALSVPAGSEVQPGSSMGTLTVQGDVTLSGSVQMELNRTNAPACDQLNCTGTLTGGGTLTVVNPGPTLQMGDSFQLFNQPVAGFAAANLPSPGPGKTWTNRLALDGSIEVIAANAIASPDGQVVATVDVWNSNLTYSVSHSGVPVIETSALGLTVNGTNLGVGVVIMATNNYTVNEAFASRHGIHAFATNNYQGQAISIFHPASGISYVLNVRTFNNGVALRYELMGGATKNVTAESTSFVIPESSVVWSQSGNSVYEGMYGSADITALATNATLGPPVTIQLSGLNGFVALTEANLGAFPNPYLTKTANAPGRELRVPYPTNQDSTTGAVMNGSVTNTPWHVIMVGADLNALVNNDMVESLSPAPDAVLFPQGAATSWAAPGRSVWDWLNPQPGGITYTNAMTNSYWASQLGWEYNTVDEGWANWNGGNPWPQVQAVVNYSTARSVKVLLWKQSSELNSQAQRTAFFQQLTNYGVAGFKADFFDYSSVSAAAKERVKLQEDILREAAAYKLVANFHGTSKPTGQFRTYPNLLQFEGVFGKEQFPGSFSHSVPPFARFLAGPADFTPLALQGGLRGARTVPFEVASMIAMPGPMITIAERSDVVAQSPFALLIKKIPAMWDETIVLEQSQIGQTAVFARRKGTDWFVAAMNPGSVRIWNIPLSFLSSNVTYQADYIRDNSSYLEVGTVMQTNVLAVSAGVEGGIVAWFYQSPTNVYQPPTNQLAGIGFDFESPFNLPGNVANTTAVGATNAQFIGQQGWSQSTSGGRGAIVTTTASGLYPGGQALGSGDPGNAYIGANTNVVLGKKFRFDLFAPGGNKAGVAGFTDPNHDGLFSQSESGVFAGVNDSGGISYFGFRDLIAGGATYSSGVAANTTDWYRITVTLDDATRTATMEVTNLTAGGLAVDLNGATAGTAFSRTWSAGLWVSPTNFVGTLARASGTLLVDNIIVLQPAVSQPVTLGVRYAGSNLQLTWSSGFLLEATNVLGPWTTNLSATSPFIVIPSVPQKFFKVQLQ